MLADPPERRNWIVTAVTGVLIASLGMLAVSLLTLLPGQVLTALGTAGTRTPTTVAPYRATGSLQPAFNARQQGVRLDLTSDAVVKADGLQRSYQLAVGQQQQASFSSATNAAARNAALSKQQQATRKNNARLDAIEQSAQIQRQVSAEMAAKAAQFKAEAAAARAAASTETTQSSQPDARTGTYTPADTSNLGTVQSGVAPITSAVIGSHFGEVGSWARYHTGLDFRAGFGTPIHAAADGIVTFSGTNGDGWAGNHVAVQHGGGISTMYSHMSQINATVGEQVKAGDVIGYVGETGRAFGAHLHFELYPAGVRPGDVYRAVDPAPWLRSIGVALH